MEKSRVNITEEAAEIVRKMKAAHGDLIFHQSGGCCDGSAPMLLTKDDFYLDDSDILLGEIEGVKFYMSQDQYEYWKHTHLTIGITKGRGSSFSVEIPLGLRFLTESRLFTEEESAYFSAIEKEKTT